MRLTDEQRESLAKADGANLVDAIVACILRLDEEAEPVHPSHLTTVVENLECERDEARAARDEALAVRANQEATIEDLGEALASAIDERDEAKADLDALARAVAQALMVPTLNDREELVDPIDHAIVGAMLGMRNARDTALARLAKVEAERDEALAVRANREATIEDLSEALARAIDERDEVLGKLVEAERYSAKVAAELVDQNFAIECERDEAIVKLVKVERERDDALAVRTSQEAWIDSLGEALASAIDERDGARAKLADVDRLLAIEEQAKRVTRAQKWAWWARCALFDADRSPLHLVRVDEAAEWVERCQVCLDEARIALSSERCKLAEMVGEGES